MAIRMMPPQTGFPNPYCQIMPPLFFNALTLICPTIGTATNNLTFRNFFGQRDDGTTAKPDCSQ